MNASSQTQRSFQNFEIGDETMRRPLIRAIGLVKQSAAEVNAALGGIDLLVNNAGGTLPGPALQCTDDELDKAFHFNVTTAFHLSRAFSPSIAARGHGSIVNFTSGLSHHV